MWDVERCMQSNWTICQNFTNFNFLLWKIKILKCFFINLSFWIAQLSYSKFHFFISNVSKKSTKHTKPSKFYIITSSENSPHRGTTRLVSKLTGLNLTKQEHIFVFVCTETPVTKPVKHETNCIVIQVNVLCLQYRMCLVDLGRDSYSRGFGFESQHCIKMDIFALNNCKIYWLFVCLNKSIVNNEKEARICSFKNTTTASVQKSLKHDLWIMIQPTGSSREGGLNICWTRLSKYYLKKGGFLIFCWCEESKYVIFGNILHIFVPNKAEIFSSWTGFSCGLWGWEI